MKRTAFAMALILSFAAPVSAAPPMVDAPSPAGSWSFKTGKMNAGCTLSGDMTITRKADKSLTCEFRALWSCELRLPRSVATEQTCTARQAGDDVVITSRMKKVGKVDPAELADYMKTNYAADHFRLKINARGDEMNGLFHSYGQAPVIFRKHLELIG